MCAFRIVILVEGNDRGFRIEKAQPKRLILPIDVLCNIAITKAQPPKSFSEPIEDIVS